VISDSALGLRPTIIVTEEVELLTIAERRVGDVTILQLTGRLVLYEGELEFRQCIDGLVAAGRVKVIVDLHGVDYIDSAGVGSLVAKYLSVRRKGGNVKLLHLSARSHRVMGITRLLSVFETFDSEEEALNSFGATVPPP
jgi:anti-sigma B factor antagonist